MLKSSLKCWYTGRYRYAPWDIIRSSRFGIYCLNLSSFFCTLGLTLSSKANPQLWSTQLLIRHRRKLLSIWVGWLPPTLGTTLGIGLCKRDCVPTGHSIWTQGGGSCAAHTIDWFLFVQSLVALWRLVDRAGHPLVFFKTLFRLFRNLKIHETTDNLLKYSIAYCYFAML